MSIVALWAGGVPARAGQGVRRRPDDQGGARLVLRREPGRPSSGTGAAARQHSARRHRRAAAARAPAGALPRTGNCPPGIGGADHRHRGRGQRPAAGRADPGAGLSRTPATRAGAVSSAATQADGTYILAGLFPTTYYLEFSATGYKTMWYPNRPDAARARAPIDPLAQGTTTGVNAVDRRAAAPASPARSTPATRCNRCAPRSPPGRCSGARRQRSPALTTHRRRRPVHAEEPAGTRRATSSPSPRPATSRAPSSTTSPAATAARADRPARRRAPVRSRGTS